jgi:hypothetical protein
MTIYENESQNIKSIYSRKNKNLSECHIGFMNSHNNINNNTNDKINKKYKSKINLVVKAKNKINDVFLKKRNLNTNRNRENDKNKDEISNITNNKLEMSMSFKSGTKLNSKSLSKRKGFISSFSINTNNISKKAKNFHIEKDKPMFKKIDKNIKNSNKSKFVPFDLNSILIVDKAKARNLNETICIVLDKCDINYTKEKNKYICWKNEIIFEFTLMNKDDKMYYVNVVNKNIDENAFKSLMNDFINSLTE